MNSAQLRQLKEILIQLAALRDSLEKLHWEIGETIPIEKSIAISKADKDLKKAIASLTVVI